MGKNSPPLHTPSQFYQLVELAVSRPINGQNWLGVWSGGEFFRIGLEP